MRPSSLWSPPFTIATFPATYIQIRANCDNGAKPGENAAADGPGTTDVDGVSWLDGRPGVRGTEFPAVGCRYARTLPSGSNCSSGSAAKPPPAGSHILSCRSPLATLHDSSRCRLSAPTVLIPPGTLTVWPPSRATRRVPTISFSVFLSTVLERSSTPPAF